jgi:hypothetical protein
MHDIFAYFLPREEDNAADKDKRVAYAMWFVNSFPQTEFANEEFLFWYFLKYAANLGVPLKEKYLVSFMNAELRELVLKNKIKIPGTETFSFQDVNQLETLMKSTRETMLAHYYGLQMASGDIDEFIADADSFMTERLEERTRDVMGRAIEMQSTMVSGMVGARDAASNLQMDITMVLDTYDRAKLAELSSVGVGRSDLFQKVMDCGIQGIDEDTLGAYTGQLFGIEAPPGMGKTRFALGTWAWRAAVIFKKDVMICALEQSKAEVESMLVARHVFHLYKLQISSKLISKKKVPPEHKDKVEAARIDLFESGKYGKLHIYTELLFLETFLQKLSLRDKLHGPYDMIVIDYMALIEQYDETRDADRKYSKNLSTWEVVARVYKRFKRYLLNTNKFGIAVNQLNAKGAEKAKADKELDTMDAQGGMEVYRSSDYNMVISATPEMESQNKRRLSNPKKRDSEGIGSIVLDTRLGVCLFWQKVESTVKKK